MANMNLVTGYIGTNHVTSNDVGSFNAALFGGGQYILNRGQKFAATVETNNKLRIYDGDLIMQGRHVRINEGDVVDLTIENGATDYNRNDLVVARYTKNASSGVEAVNLVVIKGTPVIGAAEDPAYTAGDIVNDGAMLNDMPLYRVEIKGLSLAKVTFLAEEAQSLESILELLANKVASNGHLPKMFLGTDDTGRVVVKEAPSIPEYYRVGDIYITTNSTNPASIFGGVWEQIKDRFLLAAGTSYTAGKTGGSATHKLTVDEMPSHHHGLTQQNSGGDSKAGLWDTYAKDGTYDQVYDSSQNVKVHTYGTKTAGGGVAHNNMPPYLTVYVWKRVA